MPTEQYKQFNCYKALEVLPSASPQEIRAAYFQLCKKYHPDIGGSNEAQARINLAYSVLNDPIQRVSHDEYWRLNQKTVYTQPQSTYPNRPQYPPNRPKEPQQAPKWTKPTQPRSESLSGLKNRIYQRVAEEKKKIWEDLNNRASINEIGFMQQFIYKRKETSFLASSIVVLIVLAILFQSILLWVGVVSLGIWLSFNLSGVKIAGETFSIFDTKVRDDIKLHAQKMAKESCVTDEEKLDRHFASFASLTELLLRSSSFDDSEEQVARRLTASFFLMGYMPLQYDRENRTLLFSDGDERILIRFRHRTGIATNITYVEKLYSLMMSHGSKRGYVFCSPGLTDNATHYASNHNIKGYKLEAMNIWINQVLSSDYSGPLGDILSHLDKLRSFIADISPVLSSGRSYRYNRYRY